MHPRLDPELAAWFEGIGWTELSAPQEAAIDPILDGQHLLLVAPTGHGKTEAAMIPILGRLLHERRRLLARKQPWPIGFKALYITPLRALNRDMLGRLKEWGEALGLQVGVRHGDTSQYERSKQARNPPDILITTPETAQLLLYGDKLRAHLATLRFVVLDEVHDLAQSERGAQLLVALERMEEVLSQPEALRLAKASERPCPPRASEAPSGFQRIGLSATIADPEPVAAWLGGPREVTIRQVRAEKVRNLQVRHPAVGPEHETLAAELSLSPDVVAQLLLVRKIVQDHARVLVFQNTRDGAELMVSRSALLDGGETTLELHHGSLSPEHRADVEHRFKQGETRAVVATSSLELGIDVGAIDHVVQVQSPRSIARLVQRLGRAGHRVGASSDGTLVAAGPEDILECIVVAERAVVGHLETLRLREAPLVVLANQLVAMTNEYAGLHRDWAWQVIRRAGCFQELEEDLFDAAWQALLDVETLFPAEERGRLQRGGRARKHFLNNISLIPDERSYRILDEATKRTIGQVDESFVAASLQPGDLFVMAGRSWQVLEVQAEEQRVRVAPSSELGPVPQWTGGMLPVSYDLAQGVAGLRRRLLGGEVPAVVDGDTLAAGMAPLIAQQDAGLVVPTDRNVVLEFARRQITIHVALGTAGNETLGRITQALLHQRLGNPVGLETDAYRIHLTVPGPLEQEVIPELWQALKPEGLEDLLGFLLRDSPMLRTHLIHVAKAFGALPKEMDPTRIGRKRIDGLLAHIALQEEATSRLLWERMDVDAVAAFLHALPTLEVVCQSTGPMATLGQSEVRRMLAPARGDDNLLAAVRKRIEGTDVCLVCVQCGHRVDHVVHMVPRRIHCRRCSSNQMACLRPYEEETLALLKRKPTAADKALRVRAERNAALVANFGDIACRALVARGVGPDTAARILQKSADIEAPLFWREILQAELQFARTNAFWKRKGA